MSFYQGCLALGVVIALVAVISNRLYIKWSIQKEFGRQLDLDAAGEMEIIRFTKQ